MNREEYLNIKNSGNVTIELLWEFYCDHCNEDKRKYKTIDEFRKPITVYLNNVFSNTIIQNIFNYFDNKFNIITISKNNVIIKSI